MFRNTARIALIAALGTAASAQAAMVCTGTTRFGDTLTLSVDMENARAEVKVTRKDGGVELQDSFAGIANVWDGHMTGLVSAPGLSVKYENHYGCFRNVIVTTNVRGGDLAGFIQPLSIKTCAGGSTPDDLCFRSR